MVIVENKDLTIGDFINICDLKAEAWPKYSFRDHTEWMLKNIPFDAVHCMLYANRTLESYLNLYNIQIAVDGVIKQAYGFGNLCSRNNQGLGAYLMKKVLISMKDSPALSFCNYDMVSYYRNFGWKFIHRSKCEFPNIDLDSLRVMAYNVPEFNVLTYNGNKF